METREEIETTLNQHFKDLMSDPRQDRRGDIDQIMRFIPSLLSHKQNKLLMKPTLEEIWGLKWEL